MKKRITVAKKIGSLWAAATIVLGSVSVPAFAIPDDFVQKAIASGTTQPVVAFKGAEGGGMYASGARGAYDIGEQIEVYHVTNLNDSGEGSFRDAVSKGNRIVVFDVSGNIDLEKNVTIGKDNITILGQTAPGDGICFRSNNIKVGANNVILRHIRFRVGARDANGNDTRAQDGLEITDDCENVIVDHCSVSWGTDESFSAYAVKDVTIQRSIIAEGLNQSVHDKGEHSYAAIWGGVNLSVHHNIIASHKSRNPKVGTSETVAMTNGYTDDQTLVDMKNNIFYNWGDKAGYGTENGAKTYIQNNIYKPGPATPKGKRARIFELSVGQKYKPNMLGSVYAIGNKIYVDEGDSDYNDAQIVNGDNWQDDLHIGVYVDNKFYSTADKSNIKITTPDQAYQAYNAMFPITLNDTDDAYYDVLNDSGATLPKRDAVDQRIVSNVENGTAPNGSMGSIGLVDDPLDGVPNGASDYDDRGYPIFEEVTRPAGFDTDGDGVPDVWEDMMGLDKTNPLDSTNIGPDGLTWLEIYVEEDITKSEVNDIQVSMSDFVDVYKDTDSINFTANISGDVQKVEFYCNDKIIAESVVSGGVATATATGIETGDNDVVAKAIKINGEYQLSPVVQLCVIGSQTPDGWTSVLNASYDGEDYTVQNGGALTKELSGDFDLVCKIDSMSNRRSNVFSGITANLGGSNIQIGKMYDENFEIGIYYDDGSGIKKWIGDNVRKCNLFKISYRSGEASLYTGSSLAQWQEVTRVSATAASCAVEATVLGDSKTVTTFSMLQLVTEQTSPISKITNVSPNDRLSLNSTIDVNVAPDKGKKITEIWIYFNGEPVASKEVEIESETIVSIPVIFPKVDKGILEAYCFDENLGSGVDSVNVAISQDIFPWQIADVGSSSSDEKAFILATDDYTYKISSDTNGHIGGTSDKFGYMCQEFVGDSRIYYRSRMQGGKQFGTVIKNDLSDDGATYFFGGNVGNDGKPQYQLMGRTSTGAEMTVVKDVTSDIGQSANLYFIVEKQGNFINIYQTENGATIYQTKTLIASVECAGIGDSYYMGFGAVSGATGDPSDAGWVGIESLSENNSSDTNIESYENGIVKINKGEDFVSGTVIAAGYDEGGVLVDAQTAIVIDETVEVGEVAGVTTKVMLWNNLEEMIPICEAYTGKSLVILGNSTIWNFDYGLDWLWQMQEKNVLKPSWTNETLGGNATGKMKIVIDEEYASERYIFREYLIPKDKTSIVTASSDVMMSGDKTGMNVFLQVKGGEEAFKVTFDEDGFVYFGGISTGYEYDMSKWYNIEISCDMGYGGDGANIMLRDSDGNVCANVVDASSVGFRKQINTEKKYDVTNAVFFEPIAGTSATYYVDNVSVALSDSSHVKKIIDSHFWNFGVSPEFEGLDSLSNGQTYAGLNVIGGAVLESNGKTIDGVSFPKRYKIGGSGGTSSKCVKFDVPAGTTDIVVYAEPAGSSGTRSIVINDGTENKTHLTTQMSAKHTYAGDARTIYVYGDAGINIYGISFETYVYEEK